MIFFVKAAAMKIYYRIESHSVGFSLYSLCDGRSTIELKGCFSGTCNTGETKKIYYRIESSIYGIAADTLAIMKIYYRIESSENPVQSLLAIPGRSTIELKAYYIYICGSIYWVRRSTIELKVVSQHLNVSYSIIYRKIYYRIERLSICVAIWAARLVVKIYYRIESRVTVVGGREVVD